MNEPVLLALATSGAWCSVALQRPVAGRIESHCISDPCQARHSENILAMVDELLRAAALEPAGLDGIAFDAGPGSFTGLRIACAVAQGLGFALDIPLVPVGSLRALAWQEVCREPRETGVLVANDARLNEVYMALYGIFPPDGDPAGARSAAALVTVREPAIAKRAEFDGVARDWLHAGGFRDGRRPVLRAGDAWPVNADDCAHRTRPAASGSGWTGEAGSVRADAVADLARVDWQAGRMVAAAQAAPLYLRDKVALDLAEQRAARR